MSQQQTRRQFLETTAAAVGIGALGLLDESRSSAAADTAAGPFSFGLVTDVHYADAPRKGTRYYRDSQQKLRAAVEALNRRKLPLVIELGDFIDAGPSKSDDLKYLQSIRKVFEAFRGRRHYVLGNHCVDRLTKQEFLTHCGAGSQRGYYSFDQGRFHFVVLDADFKKDGSPYTPGNFSWTDTWIHQPQQRWLAGDLEKAHPRKTLVFVHQNLDCEDEPHGVKNAPQVRRILENAGNVLAVFQGHKHSGGYRKIGGVPYCTLRAMVEGPTLQNNAYAVVTLDAADRITLEGFGRQKAVRLE